MNDTNRCQEERAKRIECKYVHDVYSSQAVIYDGLCDGPWPEIKNFLLSLRVGSFVADVGCGNGKYLTVRNDIVVHGVDTCQELSQLAYKRHKNVTIANNLNLPFHSSTMDAVLSVGVLHHFASFERRLQSVKELARILKPGGQVLIYVWAWEQKQRKFSSQDVLIPWTLESENEKGQETGFSVHDTQPNDSNNTMRTHFQTNEHRMTKFENEDSTLITLQGNGTNTGNCCSNVDDVQLSDNSEKQHRNSSRLVTSISSFTTELKQKLQGFSLSKEKKLRCDGRNSDEPDASYVQHFHSQTNCNSNGLVIPVKERFKRFYHVFIKDELSELVQSVHGLKVLTQNYDHGNWVVKAEKH